MSKQDSPLDPDFEEISDEELREATKATPENQGVEGLEE